MRLIFLSTMNENLGSFYYVAFTHFFVVLLQASAAPLLQVCVAGREGLQHRQEDRHDIQGVPQDRQRHPTQVSILTPTPPPHPSAF